MARQKRNYEHYTCPELTIEGDNENTKAKSPRKSKGKPVTGMSRSHTSVWLLSPNPNKGRTRVVASNLFSTSYLLPIMSEPQEFTIQVQSEDPKKKDKPSDDKPDLAGSSRLLKDAKDGEGEELVRGYYTHSQRFLS